MTPLEALRVRPPRDAAELQAYVQTLFGVRVPATRVCPEHCAPLDALAEAFFATTPVSIWHASRGLAGKSTLLGVLGLAELTALGATITTLGGSLIQSKRILEVMVEAWDSPLAPRGQLVTAPTANKQKLISGAWITALTASQKSARGPHPIRLRCDEVDEMALPLLHAALGQPMSRRARRGLPALRSQTVLSSTWQNPDGTMTWALKEAKAKGWPIRTWCFRETSNPIDGWLTAQAIAEAKDRMPAMMWEVEVELGEPSSEGRAFLPAAVAAAFAGPPRFAEPGELIELATPDTAFNHVHGADWAKSLDWTEILSFRVHAGGVLQLVAYERVQRLPWPDMIARLDARVARWGGVAAHDATGIGNVVADYLVADAMPVVQVGKVRGDLYTRYIAHMEAGKVLFGCQLEPLYSQHKYCARDDLFGSGHPPDGVSAGACALYAHLEGDVSAPVGAGLAERARGAAFAPPASGAHRAYPEQIP